MAIDAGNIQNKTEIINRENEADKTSIDSKFEAFSSNLLIKVTQLVDTKLNALKAWTLDTNQAMTEGKMLRRCQLFNQL